MDLDLWVIVPALALFALVNVMFGWALIVGMV